MAMSIELARTFLIENEWYWRITENASSFTASSARFVTSSSRSRSSAKGRFELADMIADDDDRGRSAFRDQRRRRRTSELATGRRSRCRQRLHRRRQSRARGRRGRIRVRADRAAALRAARRAVHRGRARRAARRSDPARADDARELAFDSVLAAEFVVDCSQRDAHVDRRGPCRPSSEPIASGPLASIVARRRARRRAARTCRARRSSPRGRSAMPPRASQCADGDAVELRRRACRARRRP